MENKKETKEWTKELCAQEAKKYKSRYAFRENCYSAWYQSAKNKWLNDFNWLKLYKTKDSNWSKENCYLESKKYNSRTEFWRNNTKIYYSSLYNGWLEEWIPRKDINSLNKVDCIYVYRFEKQKTIYVGRSVDRNRRSNQHNTLENDPVKQFVENNNLEWVKMEIIEDNLTVLEGLEREDYWIKFYKKEGWTLLNTIKGGGLGSLGIGRWSYDQIKNLSQGYKSRRDFKLNQSSAYQFLLRKHKDWLDEFFPCKNIHIKLVDQLDLEGNYIKTFNSLREASIELNFSSESKIGDCCRGKRKTAAGFKWRYHK